MKKLIFIIGVCIFYAHFSFGQAGQPGAPYQPDLFGEEVISSPNREWTTTFTPDGKTVYFTRGLSKFYIEYSVFENGKWQTPKVAPFSGMWLDTDPFITSDGKRMYFASVRPADQLSTSPADKNAHIWYVENTGENKWTKPVCLDTTINHPDVSTWYPSETKNGDFYFHSWGRPGGHGKNDIYVSKHTGHHFSQPTLLPFDTAGYSTQECRIAKDNSFMLFISNRPDGIGTTDLYVAFHKDGIWSKPINLGLTINQPGLAVMAPSLSTDEKNLYFASAFVPPSLPLKPVDNIDILNQLKTTYNGFWNIFSAPLNLKELEAKAIWTK